MKASLLTSMGSKRSNTESVPTRKVLSPSLMSTMMIPRNQTSKRWSSSFPTRSLKKLVFVSLVRTRVITKNSASLTLSLSTLPLQVTTKRLSLYRRTMASQWLTLPRRKSSEFLDLSRRVLMVFLLIPTMRMKSSLRLRKRISLDCPNLMALARTSIRRASFSMFHPVRETAEFVLMM